MSIARAKGPRGKADALFSKLVRSLGRCEHCFTQDTVALQCAHVISRRYSATRCMRENAFCLCWTCHRGFTDHPDEWMDFVDQKIGMAEYLRLKHLALEGTHRKFGTQFWEAEIVRLKALLKEKAA